MVGSPTLLAISKNFNHFFRRVNIGGRDISGNPSPGFFAGITRITGFLLCRVDEAGLKIQIKDLVFTREVFYELLRYVRLGGYPRWKDNFRPGYVLEMGAQIKKGSNPLFSGRPLGGES
ncbi:MAG: hypothetical protein ABII06_07170 [Pseudomonadota bacterium]